MGSLNYTLHKLHKCKANTAHRVELLVIGFPRDGGVECEGQGMECGGGCQGQGKHSSRSRSQLRGLRNMNSMQLPLMAIFFMTYFTRPEAMAPSTH